MIIRFSVGISCITIISIRNPQQESLHFTFHWCPLEKLELTSFSLSMSVVYPWFMQFNERTNTLLYKNIHLSHFILKMVDVSVVCERWVETGTQFVLLNIARCVIFKNPLSTSSACWLGLLNRGSLRATDLSLQAGPHSGLPVTNWLNSHQHLPIFFHNAHWLPLLLPLIYTGASLIDGSVKGQYITWVNSWENWVLSPCKCYIAIYTNMAMCKMDIKCW